MNVEYAAQCCIQLERESESRGKIIEYSSQKVRLVFHVLVSNEGEYNVSEFVFSYDAVC